MAPIAELVLLLVCAGFGTNDLAAHGVIAGTASVQAATDEVERQLRSDDPQQHAWGAYVAAQNRLRSEVPLLQERLAVAQDTKGWSPTELAILDALVQLEAKVPAQALRSSFDRWPIPALILMGAPSDV